MFGKEQIEALKSPLDATKVSTRQQGGRNLSYIEGWWAIAEANRIFGFDAWTRETIDVKCVSEKERTIGKGQYEKPGYGVTYIAKVRVTVGDIVREGCGTGHGIDADLGQAHESAIKEAETDAMKRALMTFGNPFGLALYDKSQANVATASDTETADRLKRQIDVCKTSEELEVEKSQEGFKTDLASLRHSNEALWQSVVDAGKKKAAFLAQAPAQPTAA